MQRSISNRQLVERLEKPRDNHLNLQVNSTRRYLD
jgi:hypothetical protein